MDRIQRLPALLIIIFVLLFTFLVLKLSSTPKVPESTSQKSYSAKRALAHLHQIAKTPHSSGTTNHSKVIDYIVNYCKKMGLEPVIQRQTGIRSYPGLVLAGQPQNIIVKLKGTSTNRAILIMSHYDSQSNTPGASDNGSGVASMLETISVLKQNPKLKNDIIFLFTDMEEVGLLGAESFVSQYDIKNIDVLFNFEARGNSGASLAFQVSENNGWVIREYSKSVKHAFANSLLYEIYKIMPNDTDFSMFAGTNITGLNSAFADGYPYYHSMADTPENIDVKSLQNHGDNMLSLVQHFGNLDLTNTKANDVIFFNPLPYWLAVYPVSWDLPLIILTTILFLFLVYFGIKKNRVLIKHLLMGFGLLIGSIILSLLLSWLFQKAILNIYPHYINFYGSTFYNSHYYLLSFVGMGLLAFAITFGWAVRRFSTESLLIGGLLFFVLLTFLIKLFLNTGAYLIYFPLLFIEITYLSLFIFNIEPNSKPIAYSLSQLIFLIPALSLWVPFIYLMFVLLGLAAPFGAIFVLAFTYPFLIPSFKLIATINRKLVIFISALMICIGFLLGHIHSGYSERKPLLTNLMYAADLDTKKAMWISENNNLDEWNQQYIHSTSKEVFNEFYPEWGWEVWKDKATFMHNIEPGSIKILRDTIVKNSRNLNLLITPGISTNSLELWFPFNTNIIKINQRAVESINALKESYTRLKFYAPEHNTLTLELSTTKDQKFDIRFIERKIGLPDSLIIHKLPSYISHGPRELSNSTQLKQTISF